VKIHSDKIAQGHLWSVEEGLGGISLVRSDLVGSRSRNHGWLIALSGTSRRLTNSGKYGAGDVHAATWDEWGLFLGALYAIDPDMLVGSAKWPIYHNADHFHWATADRFNEAEPSYIEGNTHRNHRWQHTGTSVTGAYETCSCKGCQALRRRVAYGREWAEIAG
jgi:hypothetical protein